jgi:glucosamine 6-phosphate synthetase-like amidotransferase/phosphosugar isomerase protein
VFISQTGTSTLTRQALHLANAQGWMTAAISESATTPIAQEAGVFIDMGCGYEEYPMRTIGFSSSVLTAMLLGMQIGRKRGFLSPQAYDKHVVNAQAAAGNIPVIIEATMAWLDTNRRNMLRSDCIIFSGSGALHGVALEGAVKVWETPQIISMGYELEEGLHGPNFGYTQSHCVIVLNDGGVEDRKARSLGRFMKLEKNNGFIVGAGTVDEQDLPFEPKGKDFCCLEFSAVVQVIAYRLATDQGRDLFTPHDNSVMNSYFRSHEEPGA